MNTTTMMRRLGKAGLLKKDGSIQEKYLSFVLSLQRGTSEQVCTPKRWHRNGRRCTLVDHTHIYTDVLKALGLKWEERNTPPRGGVDGFEIVIPRSEVAKVSQSL